MVIHRIRAIWLSAIITSWAGIAHGQATLSSADASAFMLSVPIPTYPPLAQAARVGGSVKLKITVATSGKVASVEVMEGHPLLQVAAMEAANQSMYKRYVVDGKPRAFQTIIQFLFNPPASVSLSPTPNAANNDYAQRRAQCESKLSHQKWVDAEKECAALLSSIDEMGFGDLVHGWIGTAMLGQGRYQEALDHYGKALALTESLFPQGIAPIGYAQMDLAMAYHGLRNLDIARSYYSMSETRIETAIQNAADKTSRKEFERTLDGIRRLNNLARMNAASGKVQEEIQRQLKQGSY